LKLVEERGDLNRMIIPDYCEHNGYMYWFKTRTANERNDLMDYLLKNGIQTAFHYTPLHMSEYGKKVGRFSGDDKNTTLASSCLLRLPLYHELSESEQDYIIHKINDFYCF
jgi:dTDP-4-amino-4,6-dideoxygalactose transaminase